MLNVLSLFSGIGAFEKALTNLKIPFNLLAYCEIDKFASKSYSVIHGVPESMNLRDVAKVDWLDIDDIVDLITYGFPCQDISIAGQQKGFEDEDGKRTRSGLFFEALRLIEDFNPKFAIAENVKALTSKKFVNEFRVVLESLEAAGYNNYSAVLNTMDYGIPQNRERVFIISIRKDIDIGFKFPDPIPLTLRLKDLLEDEIEVDEKYYLEGKFTEMVPINENYSELIGGTIGKMTDIYRRCYDENGIAPTLHTCPGGNTETKIYRSIESRVRKLTPTERFRFMGFTDEDCKKVQDAGISDNQINKQTGNSISVNVLEAIYRSLGEKYEEFKSAI